MDDGSGEAGGAGAGGGAAGVNLANADAERTLLRIKQKLEGVEAGEAGMTGLDWLGRRCSTPAGAALMLVQHSCGHGNLLGALLRPGTCAALHAQPPISRLPLSRTTPPGLAQARVRPVAWRGRCSSCCRMPRTPTPSAACTSGEARGLWVAAWLQVWPLTHMHRLAWLPGMFVGECSPVWPHPDHEPWHPPPSPHRWQPWV